MILSIYKVSKEMLDKVESICNNYYMKMMIPPIKHKMIDELNREVLDLYRSQDTLILHVKKNLTEDKDINYNGLRFSVEFVSDNQTCYIELYQSIITGA